MGTEARLLDSGDSRGRSPDSDREPARAEPPPLSALSVGLKCGGSDGFSGISANPAVTDTETNPYPKMPQAITPTATSPKAITPHGWQTPPR